MSRDRPLAGLVVAGGYSSRFGEGDKALAELAGRPLIRRVVDRLGATAQPLVVNCRDEQVEPIRDALQGCHGRVRFAIDPVPDRGPVAGVRTGLADLEREYTAVVACDLPFVDPELLVQLADHADGHDGAVVRLESGWPQPLQAVYRSDAMATACDATLESGSKRLLDVLERLDVVTVPATDLESIDPSAFESIDTRDDLRTVENRLETS
ncbi:molybdenum cofactor guanylyltransferase [Salinadaptatus halalkaliphilus]|uniref:Probable molybdenum cofactor guanylyltransferase n=1 Tax=Salinadaptatus halalkaliphilus TaxID=2419781 RepID=A0A4S3TKY1_9EURY|nr:molybdenum cofactor guanylyltransferase [Salinadaptatus halalkaliphilus]THE64230.1 molybdenum cofactor guanylyltransferase [Salinadaptatus halalkaliphilus]